MFYLSKQQALACLRDLTAHGIEAVLVRLQEGWAVRIGA